MPPPVAPGLILCDQLIVEERTRKVSLIGTFWSVAVPRVPTVLPPFCAYTVLTDSEGDVPVELAVTRLDTMDIVHTVRDVLTFPDRLSEVHCIMRVRDCRVTAAGMYQVTLHTRGEWIAQRRLRVRLRGASS
ncbi:MAG TPA: hypothetical protein VGF55_27410 [Gemmataceae bacterium]|jgi:hypothetical protein